MKNKRKNILGALLLLLYLFFFYSVNLCWHIHDDGIKIVHSHPGVPGHHHSQSQYQIISCINASSVDKPSDGEGTGNPFVKGVVLLSWVVEKEKYCLAQTVQFLRAPPESGIFNY